ncbi:MAG: substrate-binding domain-containing protein [Acidimicrobiia bacterium]|nr:substrate-binding domain-containing protein [Acidimicrobiia bacterium]
MTKRGLIWLIAVLAIFGLVAAACGSDDDDGDGDGGSTTTAAADGGEDEGTATTEEMTDDEGGDEATPPAGGEGSIWVLLPDSATSDRWEKDDRRFFQEGFEAAGLAEGDTFNIVNAEGDAATQISQAEQAIGDGASVIVLTSNDSGSGATIIDLARDAGVAVVEYDRFNTEGQGGDVYVSFDNVRVGATMAEVLEPEIDALGVSPARVVMQNGGEEDNNAFLFRDGYNATVEERVAGGDWELVADQFTPGWDNQEALSIFEQILVDNENDVDAVFAANDGIAGSVIAALENAQIDPTTVPVSGQDATQAGIQNVLLGKQTMSVYKPIKSEAEVAVAAALALRAGEDVTALTGDFTVIGINADGTPADGPTGDGVVPYIALVPIGVTADNVADTVVADGFRTLEELCVPEVAEVATELCADA